MNLVAAFKALNLALKGTAALSAALGTMKGGKGLAMGAAGIATYMGVMKALEADEDEETAATTTNEPSERPEAKEGKQGGDAAQQMRQRLMLLRAQIQFEKERNALQIEYLSGTQSHLKVLEADLQMEQEINRAGHERNQALAKENLSSEQRGVIQEEYNVKVAKAKGEHENTIKLLRAQEIKVREMTRLELDQLKVRNNYALQLLGFEEQRRSMNEAGYETGKAQLQRDQRLNEIAQERARYELANKDAYKEGWEYKSAIATFEEQARIAQEQYASQIRIINREEEVRLGLLRQDLEYMKKRNDLALQLGELQNKARYMSDFDVRRAQEGIDLTQKLRDIEQQREALRTSRQDVVSAEYQAEVQRLNNMESFARAEAKIRLEGIALDEQEAMSWAAGWEAALRDFGKNVQRYGDVARNMFDSVVGNMNSAIDNFVRTGKLSFKDLAKSIIQDLIAIQLKAQAAFLLNAALKGMGFAGFTAKAGGGAVSQSIPYMVGENGPELFVPQAGGAIIPTQRLGGDMGMGGQVINYNGPYIQNMSAIDTQTASQFLAKNRMAVWSANQSATRSLPQSR